MRRAGVLILALIALAPLARAAEADVAAAAAEALVARWPDLADRAEVRVVRLSPDAAAAAPPLRVRYPDAPAPPRGRVSAEVEVQQADGTWARAGWAFLQVAHMEWAAVLVRDVRRGAPVTPDDVRAERTETTTLRAALLSPDALATGAWTASRTLRAGTVLTDRLVAAPPAVEAGGTVRIAYARGDVRITLTGEARERGSVGDEVRVYCSDTRSTHRVRLTAPGAGVWTATL